jgi:hypothetical protein
VGNLGQRQASRSDGRRWPTPDGTVARRGGSDGVRQPVVGRLSCGLIVLALVACGSPPTPTVATANAAQPTPAPLESTPAPATPSAVTSPTPVPSPPPTATATPVGPAAFRVGNTGGDGAFIRRAPGLGADARLRAWADGTRLVALGERVTAEGHTWEKVRDPEGTVGYVASDFLTPDPAKPSAGATDRAAGTA